LSADALAVPELTSKIHATVDANWPPIGLYAYLRAAFSAVLPPQHARSACTGNCRKSWYLIRRNCCSAHLGTLDFC
jgi:hypothetical protein